MATITTAKQTAVIAPPLLFAWKPALAPHMRRPTVAGTQQHIVQVVQYPRIFENLSSTKHMINGERNEMMQFTHAIVVKPPCAQFVKPVRL